jgi:hypothetical protein
LILSQPARSRVHKAFHGVFRWEGTRPGRHLGLDSLVPLRRLCAEPVASGSILLAQAADKARLASAKRRLSWSDTPCAIRIPSNDGRRPQDRSSIFIPVQHLANPGASEKEAW